MIVTPFGFFEVQVKGVFWHPLEFGQPHLGHTPEALDAVNVDASARELILRMIDAKVSVAEVHQPVIPAPSIAVDHRLWVHMASNYPLQRCL